MNKVGVVTSLATIALLLPFLIVLPAARADESDQATKVTFDQPVQVPGRVLPAGTYGFVLPADINEHIEHGIEGLMKDAPRPGRTPSISRASLIEKTTPSSPTTATQ